MQIMRDERKGRLHVRFRAVSDSLDAAAGYMGQSADHEPSALGVLDGTKQVYEQFSLSTWIHQRAQQ